MLQPHEYPERHLVMVSGMTPQVITETLYGLAVQQEPRFIPTRIQVITTLPGFMNIKMALLDKDNGYFYKLIREYGLPEIEFDASCIELIPGADRQPLQDIRTAEDNERCANVLTTVMAKLTKNPDAAIHVSIAGGRKTMGFYIGYVLSLFGRHQDRLSHVLVSENYESLTGFFYPTRESEAVHDPRKGRYLDARDAQVSLAEIPFVRMRDGLTDQLASSELTFSEAVQHANNATRKPRLEIQIRGRDLEIYAGATRVRIEMEAKKAWVYAWIASRKMLAQGPVRLVGSRDSGYIPCEASARSLVDFYMKYSGLDEDEVWEHFSALFTQANSGGAQDQVVGLRRNKLDPINSHVNRNLEEKLGAGIADHYLIKNTGRLERDKGRPVGVYSLALPADCIVIKKQDGSRLVESV